MPVILVTSATGQQGIPTVENLLAKGATVRAMTRDASSATAQKLVSLGAIAVEASFDKPESLTKALEGVDSVFLNTLPQSSTGMLNDAHALISAARKAGVSHMVYTSVLNADWADGLQGEERDKIMRPDGFQTRYWAEKSAIEQAVRTAGFATWAIVRPGVFMSAYLDGPNGFLCPKPVPGRPDEFQVKIALDPDKVRVGLVHPGDVGNVAAEVLTDPARWNGRVVDISVDNVNWRYIMKTLERASGKKIDVQVLTKDEVKVAAVTDHILETQDVWGRKDSLADLNQLQVEGIKMRTFEQFLEENQEDIRRTFGNFV